MRLLSLFVVFPPQATRDNAVQKLKQVIKILLPFHSKVPPYVASPLQCGNAFNYKNYIRQHKKKQISKSYGYKRFGIERERIYKRENRQE